MKIVLAALEHDPLGDAWQRHCGDLPDVTVHRGSILDLDVDAVVSPANPETARPPARASSSRKRGTFAAVGARPSSATPLTSSRKSSGLPPVSSWQAAQKPSSASGDRVSRTNRAAAPMLSGAGRITVASGERERDDGKLQLGTLT